MSVIVLSEDDDSISSSVTIDNIFLEGTLLVEEEDCMLLLVREVVDGNGCFDCIDNSSGVITDGSNGILLSGSVYCCLHVSKLLRFCECDEILCLLIKQ